MAYESLDNGERALMQIHGHRSGSILVLAERLTDCPVSLRWGGNQVAGAINGQAHILDGLDQLNTLQAAGVPVPEFIVNPDYSIPMPTGGIWLARLREHSQGKDIIPVGTRIRRRRRWQDSDFFVKYVENVVREWRIHILNGHSIARGLKYYTGLRNDAGPIPEMVAPIIRSRRLGWHIRHDVKPPKGLRDVAKAATTAVGYDLGAVDILELSDGSFVTLEVNSRPAIRDEYTLSAYERAFRSL